MIETCLGSLLEFAQRVENRVNADRIVSAGTLPERKRHDAPLMHACRHLCANSGRAPKCGVLACRKQAFQFFSARTGRLPRSKSDQYLLAEVDALTPRVGNRQGLRARVGAPPTAEMAPASDSDKQRHQLVRIRELNSNKRFRRQARKPPYRLALSGLSREHTSTFTLTSVRGLYPLTVAGDIWHPPAQFDCFNRGPEVAATIPPLTRAPFIRQCLRRWQDLGSTRV